MQERVTELIGRMQDSDMMGTCRMSSQLIIVTALLYTVGLLVLNDTLNALFIRYDRHVKNRQAVLQGATEGPGESEQTTELITVPTTSTNASDVVMICT